MARLRGIAEEPIPFGAPVLCRSFRVRLAPPELANAHALSRSLWPGDPEEFRVGDCVECEPVEGLGARNLRALADGPLMDANALFLPAGRLSVAEHQARERAQFAAAGIATAPGQPQDVGQTVTDSSGLQGLTVCAARPEGAGEARRSEGGSG